MKDLFIDLETRSSVDITKCGSYKYAQSEDFEILLFAYKVDSNETIVIDLAQGEHIPDEIVLALEDKKVRKHAYNAAFEWYCLNVAGFNTPIDQWWCTMIHGLYCGYPQGLANIGMAIGLPEDKQKMKAGRALIKYFCCPCRPTSNNGNRTWNLPHHDKDKWELFKAYNKQDVDTEYEIAKRLIFPLPEKEHEAWVRDIKMNAYGIHVDMDLVHGALEIDAHITDSLMATAREITGLANPNSRNQLIGWLQKETGEEIDSLTKSVVADMLEREDLSDEVKHVLGIRQRLGKTSVSKYQAMERAVGWGDRVRGLLQFYGANRTGRWAGRLVQVQNLPRNYISTLDEAREMIKACNVEGIKMVYGNVHDTLSQLIRTAFIPSKGNKIIVSDFSAIEARVIAYLAGEDWVLDVFRNGGDIYCATAGKMFNVPCEKNGVNGHLRPKGKIATLALGYQGGIGALKAMGANRMGIPENELQGIVDMWREANPNIKKLWYAINDAAITALETGVPQMPDMGNAPGSQLVFRLESDIENNKSYLSVELPSGRKLFYVDPSISEDRWGRPAIKYMNMNQTSRKWQPEDTYGGKLTENIVQAFARDCLSETIKRIDESGYKIVMHIHDEVVIDATEDQNLDEVNAIFAQPIDWAPGLPLKGDGFEADYYMKD